MNPDKYSLMPTSDDFCAGGYIVAGENIDQVVAGESWNIRTTYEADLDERRR